MDFRGARGISPRCVPVRAAQLAGRGIAGAYPHHPSGPESRPEIFRESRQGGRVSGTGTRPRDDRNPGRLLFISYDLKLTGMRQSSRLSASGALHNNEGTKTERHTRYIDRSLKTVFPPWARSSNVAVLGMANTRTCEGNEMAGCLTPT